MREKTRKLVAGGLFALCLIPAPAALAAEIATLFDQAPVSTERLAENRGGHDDVVEMLGGMVANSSNNFSQTQLTNPQNTVAGGSLAGAQGVFTTIQNIGNNVIIQTSTSIVVNFND